MDVALVCTALLGLLVFGLGFGVSANRASAATNIGFPDDPTDRLYKMVRAHANATEYSPMLAAVMIAIGLQGASTWMLWVFGIVTAARYAHAAGMVLSPDLRQPHALRFAGALLTYIGGLVLSVALLFVA